MNLKKALKILKEQGYKVEKIGKEYYFGYDSIDDEPISPRELIHIAREYTSEGRNTNVKKNVKHYRHRKNRNSTREDIQKERFDNFSQGYLRKDDDIWSWD